MPGRRNGSTERGGKRPTAVHAEPTVAQVTFAKAVRRHVDCPTADVPGETVRAVLDGYFARYPDVRRYILDEQASVRRHIAIFLNDTQVIDRSGLADAVAPDDRISVFQALSGGAP